MFLSIIFFVFTIQAPVYVRLIYYNNYIEICNQHVVKVKLSAFFFIVDLVVLINTTQSRRGWYSSSSSSSSLLLL